MHGISANTKTLLSQVAVGQRARVTGFVDTSDYNGQLKRLGLIEGTEFLVVRKAPLGDPVEIRLRDYSLALRPHEATSVLIQILEQ